MTATEKDLSLMKVHVFKTVDEYEAARSGGLTASAKNGE